MTDPVERLIAAWLDWEAAPTYRPVVIAKLAALAALGLPSSEAHALIAAARRGGYDVPSAVQRAVLDLTEYREAS